MRRLIGLLLLGVQAVSAEAPAPIGRVFEHAKAKERVEAVERALAAVKAAKEYIAQLESIYKGLSGFSQSLDASYAKTLQSFRALIDEEQQELDDALQGAHLHHHKKSAQAKKEKLEAEFAGEEVASASKTHKTTIEHGVHVAAHARAKELHHGTTQMLTEIERADKMLTQMESIVAELKNFQQSIGTAQKDAFSQFVSDLEKIATTQRALHGKSVEQKPVFEQAQKLAEKHIEKTAKVLMAKGKTAEEIQQIPRHSALYNEHHKLDKASQDVASQGTAPQASR